MTCFFKRAAFQFSTQKLICRVQWTPFSAAHKCSWFGWDAGSPLLSSQVFVETHPEIETVLGNKVSQREEGGSICIGMSDPEGGRFPYTAVWEDQAFNRGGGWEVHERRGSLTRPTSEGSSF